MRRMTSKNHQHQQAGFTLVEALVATTVLMTFFAAISIIMHMVMNLVGESRVRLVAATLAQQRMEQVRNLSYADVGVIGGIPPGSLTQVEEVEINGQLFTINTGVVFIDDPFDGLAPDDPVSTDYKRVRVAISWEGAYPSKRPLVLFSDVAPKGLETMGSGGVLWINVINAVGDPVEGANVKIRNTEVIPNIDLEVLSDSKGRVVLPGAPECIACYEIEVSKSGYSNDKTYSNAEVTNPLQPFATIIPGEVTPLTFAIDRVGSLSILTTGSRANNYPPFAGVQFILKGSKTIGTDEMDQSVYKYEQRIVSGQGGLVTVNNLAWDTYSISLPTEASVDMSGINPINPISLLPSQNRSVWLVTSAASAHSLLVIIQDSQLALIESADVRLMGPTGTVSAGLTGLNNKGDTGQIWFRDLSPLTYTLIASKSGFLEATASALVSGDKIESIQLMSSQ